MDLRLQRLCIVAAFVGALIIMMTAARGTENIPQSESKSATLARPNDSPDAHRPSSDNAQELPELEVIRRQFASPLQGSVFAPVKDAQQPPFAEAYRRLATQLEYGSQSLMQDPATLKSEPPSDLVGQLRNTATWLDEQADVLERGRHYRRADRLRRLAEQVRRTARQEDQLGSTPTN